MREGLLRVRGNHVGESQRSCVELEKTVSGVTNMREFIPKRMVGPRFGYYGVMEDDLKEDVGVDCGKCSSTACLRRWRILGRG